MREPITFLEDQHHLGIAAPSALRSERLRANLELLPNPFLEPLLGPIEREDKAAAGTIKIILRPVNQRGRSKALLSDGTVLVASSRHPYLDAARILIAAGYDPDSWLEGWPPGTKAFASRARLGIAARLTIDETKTRLRNGRPFPSRRPPPASIILKQQLPTLAPGVDGLLQPPRALLNEEAESIPSAPTR